MRNLFVTVLIAVLLVFALAALSGSGGVSSEEGVLTVLLADGPPLDPTLLTEDYLQDIVTRAVAPVYTEWEFRYIRDTSVVIQTDQDNSLSNSQNTRKEATTANDGRRLILKCPFEVVGYTSEMKQYLYGPKAGC